MPLLEVSLATKRYAPLQKGKMLRHGLLQV